MNWILLRAVIQARRQGLLHLRAADEPIRLDCLADACAKCCRLLGSPHVTAEEAVHIDPAALRTVNGERFLRSEGTRCGMLKEGLCGIYTSRPGGCREYPWYNIDGRLYYDAGCPGMKSDRDERPDAGRIQPFENFFPNTPRFLLALVRRIVLA